MKLALKILIGMVLVITAVIFWSVKFTDFWKVDKCIDLGGYWNYQTKQCIGSKFVNENLEPRP